MDSPLALWTVSSIRTRMHSVPQPAHGIPTAALPLDLQVTAGHCPLGARHRAPSARRLPQRAPKAYAPPCVTNNEFCLCLSWVHCSSCSMRLRAPAGCSNRTVVTSARRHMVDGMLSN